ncbi:peptidylprolyl isomerase [Dissulfurispira thermophila]|uniref:peptidylprolyl isomerase n=2 Tax=root TaxID=1 RepID=A0A7G1GYI6_9BACT|nr:peptidylprolyl isomerase [Dissulfurispira thermophila]BCB95258.1 peptidylprolyl isomerase [Dissulfurispira thermophila]
MKRFLLIIIIFAFVASCAKESSQKGSYVMKIDGNVYTQEDIQAEIATLPDMAREFFQGPEGAQRFVDELVKKELLYTEAKNRGLDKDKDFLKKLEEFKKITLINQLLEREIETASKITDKDIKDYYDKHKEDFTVNTQVRISHIVVKTEDDAKKVYERLKKGEDFAKIASDVSLDKASAKTGGDIGNFKRGEMKSELEDVAFRLKKGEISMPVKLKDGIHILKVTDAKGSVLEFEKVKGLIGQRIAAEKQRESFDKLIENLKKKHKIDINKDALSKITFAPAPAQK